MRIDTRKPVAKTSRKRRMAAGNGGGFFPLLDETAETGSRQPPARVGAAIPVSDISVLLAIQDVSREGRRKRDMAHGFATLDALDALKADMLAGRVGRTRLAHIAALAGRRRELEDEPELAMILDHIKLRARVELAKLESLAQSG